jgi:hypothetical protein
MPSKTLLALVITISFSGACAQAQVAPPRVKPLTGDWRSAIEQKIESDYALTQLTADKSDIVTAGAVLVLKKNSLVMHQQAVLSNANTYKGGKLSAGFFGSICKNAQDGNCRTFVKGEKFWLIQVDVKDDGLMLQFISDPLPDTRFLGSLKFPFAKGSQPTPEEMAAVVAEVIGVDAAAQAQPSAAAAPVPAPAPPPAAVEQAPAPIPPPPPPVDQPAAPPPEIKLGQTKDQVIAAFGQPQKIVTLGTKQILFFKDLKVTLVGGKVTDVQ